MIYIDTDIERIDLNKALQLVSQQRREQALRFRHDNDRRLSVAVYLLLKRALNEEYGITENPVFGYEDDGKPHIIGHTDIHFNLSHCRCAAVCAVSDRPVGIDVETIRPLHEPLARYVLNDEEYKRVMSADRPNVEFIRLWTMKESLLKLTGKGLRKELRTLLPCEGVEFKTTVERDFIYTVCQNTL